MLEILLIISRKRKQGYDRKRQFIVFQFISTNFYLHSLSLPFIFTLQILSVLDLLVHGKGRLRVCRMAYWFDLHVIAGNEKCRIRHSRLALVRHGPVFNALELAVAQYLQLQMALVKI